MSKDLMVRIAPEFTEEKQVTKITIVGVGAVGMACANAILLRGVCNKIALIDVMENKAKGEVLDMEQCAQFCHGIKVIGGSDYADSKDSNIVVISAGARQEEGESRLNLVQRNVDIFKKIIPQIVKYSPNCILVVVSNPGNSSFVFNLFNIVEIISYVAWKLSGFPAHRVFGTGTILDSARFRHMLSKKLNISASSVHGYIIGEHGDSSVPVWSCVNIAGVRLSKHLPDIGTDKDPENFAKIHKDVVDSAYEIIRLKGYTSWAIGVSTATLCNSIINNHHSVWPLSTLAKGFHGITDEIYISLPCLVTNHGITHVIPQELNEDETAKLLNSAKTLSTIAAGLKW
ncbi:hypothetical protein Ciccas_002761 [Cichlidogyrus casuarinus]|uniref:L-lactate dehydrogenase n=1 Tax=Cichlidogyrus casuarinus TaxID=1844966 RepID=A0ABD2QGJ0_9PLAT